MSTVYYALGGGRGHLQRARNLSPRFAPVTILHQDAGWDATATRSPPGTTLVHLPHPTPDQVRAYTKAATHLIVDSFPAGIGHELPPHPHATLIARYVDRRAYADYDAHAASYAHTLLPYDHRCEWQDPPQGERIGPVRRTLRWSDPIDLLVIGSGEPPSWTPLLSHAPRITDPVDILPRARRIVALQCGYNLFWELADTGISCAFRPLPRRYDDQFRRAHLFAEHGTPLLHRADLVRFLVDSAP